MKILLTVIALILSVQVTASDIKDSWLNNVSNCSYYGALAKYSFDYEPRPNQKVIGSVAERLCNSTHVHVEKLASSDGFIISNEILKGNAVTVVTFTVIPNETKTHWKIAAYVGYSVEGNFIWDVTPKEALQSLIRTLPRIPL